MRVLEKEQPGRKGALGRSGSSWVQTSAEVFQCCHSLKVSSGLMPVYVSWGHLANAWAPLLGGELCCLSKEQIFRTINTTVGAVDVGTLEDCLGRGGGEAWHPNRENWCPAELQPDEGASAKPGEAWAGDQPAPHSFPQHSVPSARSKGLPPSSRPTPFLTGAAGRAKLQSLSTF